MRTPHKLIGSALCLTLITQLAACGTIFYPERRGQVSGRIDPAIAVMNAIGLLFYIIPGLLAFAVDSTTAPETRPSRACPAAAMHRLTRNSCKKPSTRMAASTICASKPSSKIKPGTACRWTIPT